MYAHQVIEAIRTQELQFRCHGARPDAATYQILNPLFETQARAIAEAEKFHMGEWDTWDEQSLIETAELFSRAGVLILPYPIIWIDGWAVERGCFMKQGALLVDYMEGISAFQFICFDGTWFSPMGVCSLILGEYHARPLSDHPSILRANDPLDITWLRACFAAVAALSATGVKHHRMEPPERLNKSRQNKGRIPLFSYWVLRVDIPGRDGLPDGALGHERDAPRLHWVRGHLRRRAHEPESVPPSIPVQAHLRGVASAGFAAKDYNVNHRGPSAFSALSAVSP